MSSSRTLTVDGEQGAAECRPGLGRRPPPRPSPRADRLPGIGAFLYGGSIFLDSPTRTRGVGNLPATPNVCAPVAPRRGALRYVWGAGRAGRAGDRLWLLGYGSYPARSPRAGGATATCPFSWDDQGPPRRCARTLRTPSPLRNAGGRAPPNPISRRLRRAPAGGSEGPQTSARVPSQRGTQPRARASATSSLAPGWVPHAPRAATAPASGRVARSARVRSSPAAGPPAAGNSGVCG